MYILHVTLEIIAAYLTLGFIVSCYYQLKFRHASTYNFVLICVIWFPLMVIVVWQWISAFNRRRRGGL